MLCVSYAVGVIEIIFWNCFIYDCKALYVLYRLRGPLCCIIVKHAMRVLNENRFVFAKCVQIDVTHIRLYNIYMRDVSRLFGHCICEIGSRAVDLRVPFQFAPKDQLSLIINS